VPRILVDFPTLPDTLEQLRTIPDVQVDVVADPGMSGPLTLPAARLADVELLLCTFPPKNLEDMPDLRFIQISSSGYTQLFGLGLVEKGVRASNARGVFDVPIAEWNLAMMINLHRDLRRMIRNQEAGNWEKDDRFQRSVRGKVVGFWGYGGIARETARQAKALGMTVHTLTRSGVHPRTDIYCKPGTGDPQGVLPDRVFSPAETETFLSGLDFLVLSLPLTKATEGLLGEAELRALQPTAFLLNPARGPIVQEAALIRALTEDWFAGAALDTHYHYPMPPDHPLWSMPNVIMTPHISGSSGGDYYLPAIWDIFIQNVNRYRQGQPLLNELSAKELMGQ
jgi:phosphoglycerate dehydrogenase-like enzyme